MFRVSCDVIFISDNVVSMAPKVEREDIDQWIVGNTVKIHWNSTSLPSSHHATVDVMGFQVKCSTWNNSNLYEAYDDLMEI